MARMTRTIISIPEDEKKWIDGFGKRHRVSSAEVVRLAVREFRRQRAGTGTGADGAKVTEERSVYGPPLPADIVDPEELKRRAIAAAGRFESNVPDLSIKHDQYLADEWTEGGIKSGSPGGPAGAASKKGGGRQ